MGKFRPLAPAEIEDWIEHRYRHIRQRYRLVSLAKIERLVGALAIVRTVELAKLQRLKRPPARDTAPPGFRRRTPRAGAWRATLGGRFREALRHRDPR